VGKIFKRRGSRSGMPSPSMRTSSSALLNDPGFIANIGDRVVRTKRDAARYLAERVIAAYARAVRRAIGAPTGGSSTIACSSRPMRTVSSSSTPASACATSIIRTGRRTPASRASRGRCSASICASRIPRFARSRRSASPRGMSATSCPSPLRSCRRARGFSRGHDPSARCGMAGGGGSSGGLRGAQPLSALAVRRGALLAYRASHGWVSRPSTGWKACRPRS